MSCVQVRYDFYLVIFIMSDEFMKEIVFEFLEN